MVAGALAGATLPPSREPYARAVRLASKVALALGVFVAAVLVAEAAGAADLGTALGIGQVAFALALVALLLLT